MGGNRAAWAWILSSLAVVGPAGAADLIEPWAPGPSDLELFVQLEPDARPVTSSLLGFGLGGGLSAGISLASGEDPSDLGVVLFWSRSLGRFGELDLFAEASAAAREVELDELGTSYGFEWSAPGAGPRAYVRLHAADGDTGWRFHPLLGWNLPLGRCDLHLEASSEQPAAGDRWPIHLAIGPNFALGADAELVPELSILHDRGAGTTEIALSVGVVTSPSAIAAALGGH
jgi:hypothetical protein